MTHVTIYYANASFKPSNVHALQQFGTLYGVAVAIGCCHGDKPKRVSTNRPVISNKIFILHSQILFINCLQVFNLTVKNYFI